MSNELSRCDSAIAQTRCSNGDNEDKNRLCDEFSGTATAAVVTAATAAVVTSPTPPSLEEFFIFNLGGIYVYLVNEQARNSILYERAKTNTKKIEIIFNDLRITLSNDNDNDLIQQQHQDLPPRIQQRIHGRRITLLEGSSV
jgi:hypothetical protein